MRQTFHESYDREAPGLPSDRSTGLVFAAVALVVALIWRDSAAVLWVALPLAAGFAGVALAVPRLLRPLNIAWMKLAELIGRVMNPIVMFVLFAVAIVPAGLLMQLFRDPLRRRPKGPTHWVTREPDETASMKNQF